ncbi:MAG: hypothetical protein LAT82_01490 [Nanoarchaeota archaeon]|nr:hypothetical protein [Nanoarchaeota archaeon]
MKSQIKNNLLKGLVPLLMVTATPALSQERDLATRLSQNLTECKQSLEFEDEREFVKDYISELQSTGTLSGMNRIVTDTLMYYGSRGNESCEESLNLYGQMLNYRN